MEEEHLIQEDTIIGQASCEVIHLQELRYRMDSLVSLSAALKGNSLLEQESL